MSPGVLSPGETDVYPATEINAEALPSLPTVSVKSITSDYVVNEEPIHSRRPLRIICMGAGYSGLMMGIVYSQKLAMNNSEFVMYERNKDLGGTWLENRYYKPLMSVLVQYLLTIFRYPGCQCDIPAHNYAFSFEPNPEWPNYYATSTQIYDYMKKISSKYKIDQYMTFNHEIISAIWDERGAQWCLKVMHGETVFEDKCDIFINAGGVLK
jgi:cation diffusion facilitator CzcD-associated flavoprotein CzcO